MLPILPPTEEQLQKLLIRINTYNLIGIDGITDQIMVDGDSIVVYKQLTWVLFRELMKKEHDLKASEGEHEVQRRFVDHLQDEMKDTKAELTTARLMMEKLKNERRP